MMTRRITLTIAAAILGLILLGILVFAGTGDGEIEAVSEHTIFLGES